MCLHTTGSMLRCGKIAVRKKEGDRLEEIIYELQLRTS